MVISRRTGRSFCRNVCLPKYLQALFDQEKLDFIFVNESKCLLQYELIDKQIICQHMQDVARRFNEILLYMKIVSLPATYEEFEEATSSTIFDGYPSGQCRFDIARSASFNLGLEVKRNNCWFASEEQKPILRSHLPK